MNYLRILVAFGLLMIISIILQFATVPFSSVHNTFELLESVDRSVRGLVWGGLVWVATRLIKGEQKAPEFSRFIFFIAVAFLLAQSVYDLLAT